MQGQRSSMGSLPDFISFDLNPTATDAGPLPDFISFDLNPTATDTNIEQPPIFWNNNIQNHTQNISPNPYLIPSNQAQNLSGWNIGESSSSGNLPYSPLFMQSASNNSIFPQNQNIRVEVGENSGNNRHVIEENTPNGGYFGEETYSSDGCRLSCKRKAIEGHIGQSSSSGSSNKDWYNAHFGSSSSESTLPLNLGPNLENSRSSHRVRIDSSPTIHPNLNISDNSNSNISPLSNFQGMRTPQLSRWNRGSSSRTGDSLSFRERVSIPNVETESNTSLRNIPEIPNFQVPRHPDRAPPRYSSRLSEYLRRLSESGGQNSNLAQQISSSSSSQEVANSTGVDRLSRLRSAFLLERQLDGSLEGARSSRSAVVGPEGRRQLVSEIRNVLDLMRRGEPLRLEDVFILDQSIFFGMTDIHDRHRDMRLDVDNMSYEELLALEERMGSVSTGLSEETILKGLKKKKFFSIAMGSQSEVEPCCICREEYNDGEDIGTVECGHEFHSKCIKQWLMLKNSCPICKTTALNK